MRSAPAEQASSDPLRWMEPLIVDVISGGYTRLVADSANAAALARRHVLLWRCVLSRRAEAETFQRELSRLAGLSGLDARAVEDLDRQVIAELLDTIAARFTRSPREAGRLSFEVTRAACQLAQAPRRVPA